MLALLLLAAAAPVTLEQYDPDRPLARSDYEGRTLRELTLMRNIGYAKAHNPFRRKWLKSGRIRYDQEFWGSGRRIG